MMAAVLLAAGGAQRMGGRPKALLELDGVPLVRRQAEALLAELQGPVVIVTGHHGEAMAAAVQGLPLMRVHQPDWTQGQAASVRAGLAALAGVPQPVLMALADMPAIDRPALQALTQAWHARPAGTEVLVPFVDGERGNPVLLGMSVCAAVRSDPRWPSPREWQSAHPQAVYRWSTSNTAYRIDIDTPEALERFNRAGIGTLRWPGE
jgi:molybdenum cofactor cytidylyltransferase